MWSQVAHRHLLGSIRAKSGFTKEPVHVQRRPVRRQCLAKITHPVMIKEEMHPAGQGVPGLEPLDVDGERRVPAATRL